MARAKTKKTTAPTGNEVIENPEVLAEKLSGFEEYLMRNKSIVLSIAAVIAITIGGFLGYRYYIDRQDSTAQIEMFQAVYYFEADDYQQALNGDGNNYGFLEIINRYGSTDAGNLSHFYAGVSYLKLGEFQNAIDHLSDFSADDFLIQARAYSLIGDAYIELLNFNEAGRYYERAANHKTNDFFSPQYHLKAGLAFERLNNNEAALRNYDRIVNQYFDSNEYQIARKHMARLEALASR
jgi:tetratricopeptide (TPR) repeat protein